MQEEALSVGAEGGHGLLGRCRGRGGARGEYVQGEVQLSKGVLSGVLPSALLLCQLCLRFWESGLKGRCIPRCIYAVGLKGRCILRCLHAAGLKGCAVTLDMSL